MRRSSRCAGSHPAREGLSERGRFPREARVRERWEFDRIHREGVRVHSRFFTVIACLAVSGERARFGAAVSRRVGNAVLRNRLRRSMKEAFRRTSGALPAADFVVVVRAPAAELAGLWAVADELLPLFEAASRRIEGRAARDPRDVGSARGGGRPKPSGGRRGSR